MLLPSGRAAATGAGAEPSAAPAPETGTNKKEKRETKKERERERGNAFVREATHAVEQAVRGGSWRRGRAAERG